MKHYLLTGAVATALLFTSCNLVDDKASGTEKSNDSTDTINTEPVEVPDSVTIRLPKELMSISNGEINSTRTYDWTYNSTTHAFESPTENGSTERYWFTPFGKQEVRMEEGITDHKNYTAFAEVYTWEDTTYKRNTRYFLGSGMSPLESQVYDENFFPVKTVLRNSDFDTTTGESYLYFTDSIITKEYTFTNGVVSQRTTTNNYNDSVVVDDITVTQDGIYTLFAPSVLPDGVDSCRAIISKGSIPQEIRGVYNDMGRDSLGNPLRISALWEIGQDGLFEEYIWDTENNAYRSLMTFTERKVASADLGSPLPFAWE